MFQAGTECNTDPGEVFVWWEWLPGFQIRISNFPISVGNSIFCQLTVLSNTTGKVIFCNVTGAYPWPTVSFNVSSPSGTPLSRNVAEWIVERPTVNGVVSRLANYGEVNFWDCVSFGGGGLPTSQGLADMVDETGRIVSSPQLGGQFGIKCRYVG